MSREDRLPTPRRLLLLRRYWRIMRLMALLSMLLATIAVALLVRGDDGPHIHMMIAAALVVGLIVLIGMGLMTLPFLSSSSGYDDPAQRHQKDTS